MKIPRKYLLIAILSLGAFLILYSILRELFHFNLGESFDKNMPNVVFIVAIGLFLWNRQIARDEANEKAKKLEAGAMPVEAAEKSDSGEPAGVAKKDESAEAADTPDDAEAKMRESAPRG